jgi:homogentisate 1,2-dioxygenase
MFPLTKGQVARQAHVGVPAGTHEEEHARHGFSGRASHLFHLRPPTAWSRVEGPLRPRLFRSQDLASGASDGDGRPTILLRNGDVAIGVVRLTQGAEAFLRNGDGDELHFIHAGRGLYETDYGQLACEPGDYLWFPKGTTYRAIPSEPTTVLVVESRHELEWPDRGPLGQHTFIDPAMIETPEPKPEDVIGGEFELRVKRRDQWTSFYYDFHPLDVVGWKGTLSPARFNVRDFRPVVSVRAQLPPTVHATLVARGLGIFTFVPRPFPAEPEVLRVPFYHRNVDNDELIFYHAGEFMSRRGVDPGSLTLHPQGIDHGPHPKAAEAARTREWSTEVAILIETEESLEPTAAAHAIEDHDYVKTWVAGA